MKNVTVNPDQSVTVEEDCGENPAYNDGVRDIPAHQAKRTWQVGSMQIEKHLDTWDRNVAKEKATRLSPGDKSMLQDIANEAKKNFR